ncbi:uncharacterized protein PV07_12590 [Cladophialophora immunda]|uniref:Uncharacterized protein n=1 Tax=Cladophialophora immunda TaxID=569365 RepID=A0A0D2BUE7_9EURO|nr:uncharacterized protein PV07_12590 [Cladophialophora immunda]KIW22005.1 hypothetical protein PV07_12590 [Cladophialophora immunda]
METDTLASLSVSQSTCITGVHKDGEFCILSEETLEESNLDPEPLQKIMGEILKGAGAFQASGAETEPMMPEKVRVACNGELRTITWTPYTLIISEVDDTLTGTFAWVCHKSWYNTIYRNQNFSRSDGGNDINYMRGAVLCRKSVLRALETFRQGSKHVDDLCSMIKSLDVEHFVIDQNHGVKDLDGNCDNLSNRYIRAHLPDGYESDCVELDLPRRQPKRPRKRRHTNTKD